LEKKKGKKECNERVKQVRCNLKKKRTIENKSGPPAPGSQKKMAQNKAAKRVGLGVGETENPGSPKNKKSNVPVRGKEQFFKGVKKEEQVFSGLTWKRVGEKGRGCS